MRARIRRFRNHRDVRWLGVVAVAVVAAYAPAWARGEVFYELDTKIYFAPLLEYAASVIRAGSLPLWNPYLGMGYPQFANGEMGVLFPLHAPFLWTGKSHELLIWGPVLRALLASAAAYFFARSLRISAPGSALSAVAFGLGSFATAQQHHLSVANSLFALPAILGSWEMAFRSATPARRLAWFAAAGIALATAGLAVHPQILVTSGFGFVIYAALSLLSRRWSTGAGRTGLMRTLGWAGAGSLICVGIGGGVAAIQLAPLFELITQSDRAIPLSAAEASRFSLLPFGSAQLLFPDILGNGAGFWSSWNRWETSLYVGTIPLAFAALALTSRRRVAWILVFMAVFSWLVAQGSHGPLPLYEALRAVPGFDRARAPGRYTLITVLALATLAGVGFDAIRARPRARLALGLSAVLVGAWIGLLGVHSWIGSTPGTRWQAAEWVNGLPDLPMRRSAASVDELLLAATSPWQAANLVPTLSGLATLVAVVAARREPFRRLLPGAVVALGSAQLAYFAATFHPRASPAALLAVPSFVAYAPAPGTFPRALVDPAFAAGLNQLITSRVADASGYVSLPSARLRELLGEWRKHPHRLARAMGVKTAFFAEEAEGGFKSFFAELDAMSYSLVRPALVVDAWSPPQDGTVALPPQTPLGEIRLIASVQGALDAEQGAEIARLEWLQRGEVIGFRALNAGEDLSERTGFGSQRHRQPAHGEANVVVTAGIGRESIYTFVSARPPSEVEPDEFRVRVTRPGAVVAVHGMTAIDAAGGSQSLWTPPLKQIEISPPVLAADFDPGQRVALHARVQFARDRRHAFELMTRGDSEYPLRPVVEPGPWGPGLDSGLLGTVVEAPQQSGDVEIESESATELIIRTRSESPGILVVRDAYDPGWKAFIDRRPVPIFPADIVSRGVPVPAGAHTVTLRYDPASLRLGKAISAITLGATAAAGLALWQWPRIARILRGRQP